MPPRNLRGDAFSLPRVLSLYAQDIRMIRKGDHVLVEISGAAEDGYILQWNGARFSRFSDQQTIVKRPQTGNDNEQF